MYVPVYREEGLFKVNLWVRKPNPSEGTGKQFYYTESMGNTHLTEADDVNLFTDEPTGDNEFLNRNASGFTRRR